MGSPYGLLVAAPRPNQVGLGRSWGNSGKLHWAERQWERPSPRLALQLRPSYYLSICQTLGGPGLGAASGIGRGFGEIWEAERQRGLDPSVVSACAGEQMQRQRA